MPVEQSLDAEAVCACGCGEPVTPGRLYVHGHNRRQGPRPAERVCARPGCENLHRNSLYCSQACHFEDHRVDDGTCPTCGTTFPRIASEVARGKGRYCSIECRKTGELVACPECGAEKYRLRSELERGYRFCGWSCWMRWRWRHESEELRVKLSRAMVAAGTRASASNR